MIRNVLIGILTLYSLSSYAQDWTPPEPECLGDLRIIEITQGDASPFDGQLFTNDAAACLAIRIEYCVEFANEELSRADRICDAEIQALVDKLVVTEEANSEALGILEDELADALDTPWYETFAFQFSMGAVVGAGVVITTVVLIQ